MTNLLPTQKAAASSLERFTLERYVEATVRSVTGTSGRDTAIPVVYAAMHGVGAGTFFDTVDAAGFPPVHGVAEQTKPDPAFPAVSFPNPEEDGALDLSFATAQTLGAALIIAHDPDIERAVGGFASGQITLQLGASETQASLSTLLREKPPRVLGQHSVIRHDDFLEGVDGFPREDILRYFLDDDSRVIVRPSGTEPKLKVYLDTSGETGADAQAGLAVLDTAVRELLATLT
jgi:phosphomannomutase